MKHTPLAHNGDFVRAYKRGKSYVHPLLVLYLNKNRCGATRLGITASKKVGGAVLRNRARRVLRAAATAALPQSIGGRDVVLVARAATTRCKSGEAAAALAALLQKAGVLPGGGA